VIQAGYKEYLEFVPHEIFSAPLILVVVGVIIFVIAFFGCCGAMKENNCMVLTVSCLKRESWNCRLFCVTLACGKVRGGLHGLWTRR
jgi:hypothetical protein